MKTMIKIERVGIPTKDAIWLYEWIIKQSKLDDVKTAKEAFEISAEALRQLIKMNSRREQK